MSEDSPTKNLHPLEHEHGDKDLIDKNILGAMVLDTIRESYPGIQQFFTTIKLLEVNEAEAIFVVSDLMTAEWINNHYMHILEKVFHEESEEHIGIKKVIVKAQEEAPNNEIKIKKENKPKKNRQNKS